MRGSGEELNVGRNKEGERYKGTKEGGREGRMEGRKEGGKEGGEEGGKGRKEEGEEAMGGVEEGREGGREGGRKERKGWEGSLTFLVLFFYLVNLGVGTGAKNLNETLFVSPRPPHCPAEALCIVECLWFHETQNQLLQVATEL